MAYLERKREPRSGHLPDLPETEAVSGEEDGKAEDGVDIAEYTCFPEEMLDSYVKLAEECIETVEKMPPRNFNNEQCGYLVGKLKMVVQTASSFLKVSHAEGHGPRSSVEIEKRVEFFKLVLALANQIESFVQDCCKNAWIQAAMTLTNVSEYVSSIGFNLELCRVAFSKEFAATGTLTLDEVEDINKAEAEIVKKKASADVDTLFDKVILEMPSLGSENKDLAIYLLQRLRGVKPIPASVLPGSSLRDIFELGSYFGNLFTRVQQTARLGTCASGATVDQAMWLGTLVAVKTFYGPEDPDFMKEVEILAGLCHPNITSMFCSTMNKRRCSIVMELMDEDLHALMQRRLDGDSDSPPFTILEAVDIMLQIGEGVKYLHEKRIEHRDLKSFNILVRSVKVIGSKFGYVHAKVADFGLSKIKESSIRFSSHAFPMGTSRWMAPEIIHLPTMGGHGRMPGNKKAPKLSFKSDIYSFAMVCYEILTGDVPFSTISKINMVKRAIIHGDRPVLPNSCPHKLKVLIKNCWNEVPSKRPSIDDICLELKYLKYLLMMGHNQDPHLTVEEPLQAAAGDMPWQVLTNVMPSSTMMQANYADNPSHPKNNVSPDDLPMNKARYLNQGSRVKSMDFHPIQQTILLVGTNVGDIAIWEVGSSEKLAQRSFEVWDITAASMPMQAALDEDPTVSVNRAVWNLDGTLLGVAFSKDIVHIYTYNGASDLREHLEIDAHAGGVNDLAFSHPNKQLCVITCGDDKTIKVWDAATGRKQYTFEGHEAPVYSVCPHHREGIQFILSTAIDGKIKGWLYDLPGSRVDYDAPGHGRTTMAYSGDGTRLFSCGTSNDGESYLVEWNESEGAIKRTYSGFGTLSSGVVQFDTTRNRFLVVGHDTMIKFWDMDNANLLTTTKGGGSSGGSPRLRFNKEGSLLAVACSSYDIRILANRNGIQMLDRALATRPLAELNNPHHCWSTRLPDSLPPNKVARLTYTNSGLGLLALASNAVHKLWKWERNELNPIGKATASVPPALWQPASGILMTNDISDTNPEEAVPCTAHSRNDYYLMSASGGKVSLFNTKTFEVVTTFMPPPPAATFLAFHPWDINIIAIGMEDSTIQIYNVLTHEVKSKLKGHQKRITGLAFSNSLNVLVSSGADAQLCMWGTDGWEKRKSKLVQPGGRSPSVRDTRVQFHNDEVRLLVVHESQLAVYDASKLDRLRQWVPQSPFTALISNATYSCDSQLVYTGFVDGSVGVFDAESLRPRCRLAPSVYIPQAVSGSTVYPVVIAAHPLEANQFALGLSDGGVHVLEPLESVGKWY